MKTTSKIISIGNSQGIRLPKKALQESGLSGEVEIETNDNEIIIRPKRAVREGWEEDFKRMAKNGDDRLILGEFPPSEWDLHEWSAFNLGKECAKH